MRISPRYQIALLVLLVGAAFAFHMWRIGEKPLWVDEAEAWREWLLRAVAGDPIGTLVGHRAVSPSGAAALERASIVTPGERCLGPGTSR